MIHTHNLLDFLPSKQFNYEPRLNWRGINTIKLKGGKEE